MGEAGPGSERGSISVLAAGVMLMVVVMALATADVARALAAASRAQAAADAAALAAAQEMIEPTGEDPSSAAARFAEANGAQLAGCDCAPGGTQAVATVRVEISGLLLLRSGRVATATARAVLDLPGGLMGPGKPDQKSGARTGGRPVE
jgi:secretion/DNA translocation related TadE-like protein